jgi:hypothetical protein
MNTAKAFDAHGPSTRNKLMALGFWIVAVTLTVFTAPVEEQPSWIWVVRVVTPVLGIGWLIWLGRHERSLNDRHLPVHNDTIAVDLWTIAHTMAGVVMGAWGIPLPLVVLFTIGWEFFEKYGGGIGSDESLDNRIVDVVVALIGWIVLAGITTQSIGMPWLLPAVQSLIR